MLAMAPLPELNGSFGIAAGGRRTVQSAAARREVNCKARSCSLPRTASLMVGI